jgi:hypothetical protein
MAVYYVNSGAGGSATGLSWTDAWTTIDAAFTDATNPVVAGDVVLVHSAHAETNAGTTTIGSAALNPSFQDNVWIVSVDKDSSNAITSGASVSATTVVFGNINDVGMSIVGLTATASDQGSAGDLSNNTDCVLALFDCTLGHGASATSSSEFNLGNRPGTEVFNLTLDWNASGTAQGEWTNAKAQKGITCTGDTTLTDFIQNWNTTGGHTGPRRIDGVDLSNWTASATDIIGGGTNENATGNQIIISNIHLPTGTVNVPGYTFNNIFEQVTLYNASTGSNLYGLQHATYGGTVTDDTTTYLNADVNGTGFSLNYVGNANTKQCAPVGWELPLCEFWADANATIRVNMTSTDSDLDKGNTWIYIGYPDATDASLRKWVSTRDFKGIDTGTLGTPGALGSGTAFTQGGKTYNYSLTETLTSSAGPVIIYFMCAKASCDIWVDPEPVLT